MSTVGSEGDREVVKGIERSGAVDGFRSSCTHAEVEGVIDDVIARYGSFPASVVGERVLALAKGQ